MLTLLSSLSIRSLLRLGAAGILLAAAALAWHSYSARGREIVRLNAEIAAYQEAARALEVRATSLSTQLDAATAKRRAGTETLRNEIRDAPETDDAPVAPVLRHALDGLRGR